MLLQRRWSFKGSTGISQMRNTWHEGGRESDRPTLFRTVASEILHSLQPHTVGNTVTDDLELMIALCKHNGLELPDDARDIRAVSNFLGKPSVNKELQRPGIAVHLYNTGSSRVNTSASPAGYVHRFHLMVP